MAPDDRRAAGWFLAALALYFLAQLALRLAIGGALETDEAEMMLLTPGFQLGYGPQLPLYSWLQAGAFALLGKTVLALALLKNLMLWSCYAMVFAAAVIWLPVRQAILAALSWALLPDVFWEAQRATTHSVALMMMIAATLWAVSGLLRRPVAGRYALTGLVLALGGLSKFNYWFVPLALILAALMGAESRALLRGLLWRRVALLIPAVMLLVLAAPALWMARHPALAFASSGKLTSVTAELSGLPWLTGLGEAGSGALAVLLPLALVVWLIARRPRREAAPALADAALARRAGRFLMRAGAVVLALFAAMVIGSGATHVAARWLLPGFLLIAPGLVLWALAGRGWTLRRLASLAAVFAVLTLAGMAESRLRGDARGALDLARLEAEIAPLAPARLPVLADFYLGGNLAWRHPDWQIRPFLPLAAPPQPGDEVILLTRGTGGDDAARLRAAGWPAPVIAQRQEIAQITARIPYRFSDAPGLPVRALRLRIAP